VQSMWPATNVVKQHYLWATCWWRIPFRMKYYNSPKRRFNAITKRQQYWFFRLTLDKPSHQTQLQDCLGYPLHLYSSVCLFGRLLFRRLACGHELKGIAWPRTSSGCSSPPALVSLLPPIPFLERLVLGSCGVFSFTLQLYALFSHPLGVYTLRISPPEITRQH